MAKMIINGQYLHIQEEAGVLTVAFTDRADQPTTYLLLQRLLSPSDQDRRLGHDKVYVELNDQNNSAYGGIMRVKLHGSQLLLKLDAKTALLLNVDQDLEVKLNIDASEATNLRKQLGRLLKGQEVTVEI